MSSRQQNKSNRITLDQLLEETFTEEFRKEIKAEYALAERDGKIYNLVQEIQRQKQACTRYKREVEELLEMLSAAAPHAAKIWEKGRTKRNSDEGMSTRAQVRIIDDN